MNFHMNLARRYNFDTVVDRYDTCSLKWDHFASSYGKGVLPMWLADMDFTVAPEITRALEKRVSHAIYGYSYPSDNFYSALMSWYQKHHQWNLQREWILLTPGVLPALHYSIQAYTNPGDQVVVLTPLYHQFFKAIEVCDRQMVQCQLINNHGHYEIDFTDLDKKLSHAKLLLFCSPHNPVGRVWTAAELEHIGRLCLQHHVILVSDEIHCDIVFSEHCHIPTANVSKEIRDITITCISPSKTFNIPAMKNAAVVIPNAELRHRFEHILERNAISCTNILSLIAGETAYRYGEKWFLSVMEYLTDNRNFLCQYLHQRLPEISWLPTEGMFLAWLDFSKLNMSDENLQNWLLQEAKVGLEPGIKFGPSGSGFQRLNFATPRFILIEGLTRIEQAIARLHK